MGKQSGEAHRRVWEHRRVGESAEIWALAEATGNCENCDFISQGEHRHITRCLLLFQALQQSFIIGCKLPTGLLELSKRVCSGVEGCVNWTQGSDVLPDTSFDALTWLPHWYSLCSDFKQTLHVQAVECIEAKECVKCQ